MRTIALLAIMGLIAAAQTPNTPPAGPKPEPPKQATLDQKDLALLEKSLEAVQLRTALNEREKADIQTAYGALIAKACESIGGKSAEDCIPLPREAGKPAVIQLKPPVVAKGEAKK